MNLNNKWLRAAVPALLIHISVGTVYCWSTIKEQIAQQIGMSTFSVGWAFSLAIFFLGMSAAFAGRFVEKDIHKSSLISCICFTGGMVGTGLITQFATGWVALIGIYIFYGIVMGIGLGIGYLSPVKTLMLWFSNNRGLATGISIMGFGLAKALATPIMEVLQNSVGISGMFYILGGCYFVLMFIGHMLLKKPDGWSEEANTDKVNSLQLFKDKQFLGIWLMFFINIHCGLMLISYEKQILNTFFVGSAILATIVSVYPSITSGFNALGRIGYSTLSDKTNERNTIYKVIFLTCIVSLFFVFASYDGIAILILLAVVNLGYGGGFSTLPALLSERYGMKNISQIHGLTLSAWAVAGITGNNTSEIILSNTNNNYLFVFITAIALYAVAFVICVFMVGKKDKERRI